MLQFEREITALVKIADILDVKLFHVLKGALTNRFHEQNISVYLHDPNFRDVYLGEYFVPSDLFHAGVAMCKILKLPDESYLVFLKTDQQVPNIEFFFDRQGRLYFGYRRKYRM